MKRLRPNASTVHGAAHAGNSTMPKRKHPPTELSTQAAELRIIGGHFRGRKLRYEPFQVGDAAVTRPMKHRVREAIFNLVGVEAAGKHAIDLFAGTGALGLEALSRGAARATFIERHVPTARVIDDNIRALGVDDATNVHVMSAFIWAKRDVAKVHAQQASSSLSPAPWLVFCSPPYDFFVDRLDEMRELIERVAAAAPPDSLLVVEADERLDFALLSTIGGESADNAPWDVRAYPPAFVGIWHKTTAH